MSLFGGDSPDVFLLAEDEARMLGRSSVGPEHLLLAFSRRQGRVSDLPGDRGITARELHAAIVDAVGMGDEVVLGRLPRSRAAEEVLQRAVAVAAERGERRPDAVHVLLALADDGRLQAILHDLGLDDLQRLVDMHHPARKAPLSEAQIRTELVRAAMAEDPRPARAPVPAFERFTPDARRAIRASAETAALLEHREVDPFHLSVGCLQVPESFAAAGALARMGGRRTRADRRSHRVGLPAGAASVSPGDRHL